MRKLLFLPLLFFLLLLGCGDGRIEQMRALLHEQDSLNRAYQQLSLDTIRQLTDYFDHHGTNYDRVHAHYLLGSVYRDMGEAPASLTAFQHAIEVADTTAGGDSIYALLAKIHGQMGYLFTLKFLPLAAKDYYLAASNYSLESKDTLAALEYYNFLNTVYYQEDQLDSVDLLTRTIVNLYTKMGDTATAAQNYGIAIAANVKRGRLVEARRQMDAYENLSGCVDKNGVVKDPYRVYDYYRGLYFLKAGDATKAKNCFKNLLRQPTNMELTKDAYHGLSFFYANIGAYDSAYHYSILYSDANDSCYKHQNMEEMLTIQSMYRYERAQQQARQNERDKEHFRFAAFLSLLGLVLCFITFFFYRKRKDFEFVQNRLILLQKGQEIEDLKKEISEQKEMLQEYEGKNEDECMKNDALREEMRAIEQKRSLLAVEIDEKEKEIEKLQGLLYTYYSTKKYRHDFQMMARKGIALNYVDWQMIFNELSEKYPSFLTKLKGRCPSITDFEIWICVLTRMGFKVGEVANLLGKSTADISNKRKVLMKKIFGSDEGADKFDYRIKTL